MTLSCESSARQMIHMKYQYQDFILCKQKKINIFCCYCDWRFKGSANLICRGTDISYCGESLELQNNQSQL